MGTWGRSVDILAAFLCAYFLTVFTVVPYLTFSYISSYQTELKYSEYQAVANNMKESSLTFVKSNHDSMGVLSAVVGQKCPRSTDWPQCEYPMAGYAEITESLSHITKSVALEIAPFVNSSELSSFESFAFDTFDSQGYSYLGNHSFGRGIYARNTDGSLYHVTNSTVEDGGFAVPIIYAGNLDKNEAIILYNIYSNPGGINAIDNLLSCSRGTSGHQFGNTHARSCFSATDTIKLIQDDILRPSFISYHPVVPCIDNSTVAGVVASVVAWEEVFRTWSGSNSEGLTCVIRSNVSTITFSFNDGGHPMYMGDGDLHDSEYDEYRFDFEVNDGQLFSLYPNVSFGTEYDDQLPYLGAFCALGILIVTSIVVFVYAFYRYVDRQARENIIISNTKQLFVRYVSHEIRTPLNMVKMGLVVMRQEADQLVACIGTADRPAGPLGDDPAVSMNAIIAEIERNADGAVQVLNDLVSYDKIIMDKLDMSFVLSPNTRVYSILQESIESFSLQIKSQNIVLTCSCSPCVPQAKSCDSHSAATPGSCSSADIESPSNGNLEVETVIDSQKIGVVFSSVIANALKYTPDDGHISVVGKLSDCLVFVYL